MTPVTEMTAGEAIERMDTWLRALVPADGTSRWFGNVEVWIDINGPWKDQLSFGIPTDQWDMPSFNADLVTAIKSEQDLF